MFQLVNWNFLISNLTLLCLLGVFQLLLYADITFDTTIGFGKIRSTSKGDDIVYVMEVDLKHTDIRNNLPFIFLFCSEKKPNI